MDRYRLKNCIILMISYIIFIKLPLLYKVVNSKITIYDRNHSLFFSKDKLL